MCVFWEYRKVVAKTIPDYFKEEMESEDEDDEESIVIYFETVHPKV